MGRLAQQNASLVQQKPIELSELIAAIESPRKATAVHTTFSVIYWRDANMTLAFNATAFTKGWQNVEEEI